MVEEPHKCKHVNKTPSTILGVLFICSIQLIYAQEVVPRKGETVFEDNFKRGLNAGWTWVRPEASAYKIGSKGLFMRSLDGNIWGGQTSGRNFLLRMLPHLEEGVMTEVSLKSTPTGPFEQAGLIWYHSDGKYIKLVVESFNGERIVNMVREENDNATIFKQGLVDKASKPLAISFKDNKAVLIDKTTNREAEVDLNKVVADRIGLRLLVDSGNVVGQMREAGKKEWKTIARCPSLNEANLRVGFVTLMGSKEGAKWVEFDKFVIRKTKF